MRWAMLAMNSSVAISIDGEGPRHDGELDEEVGRRVDELRQEGGEEQDALRIGHRRQRPLLEQRPARSRFGCAAHIEADRRRAPDLDAEPHQVGAAGPFHAP